MPPFTAALLCMLALTLASSAGAADDLVVEAERRGERIDVRARATIAAGVPVVWQVLTDYERLPAFIPGISRSRIRAREGSRLLVEQAGEARFFLFSFPIEVQLDVVESPPQSVVSRAVGGNLRRMNGRYELAPDEARGIVVLRYFGEIEPDFGLPPIFGIVALRLMAEEQFMAMVAEIEKRAAAAK